MNRAFLKVGKEKVEVSRCDIRVEAEVVEMETDTFDTFDHLSYAGPGRTYTIELQYDDVNLLAEWFAKLKRRRKNR